LCKTAFMKHINIIYRNETGISFYWKSVSQEELKAQLVFRDTGFYFTLDQLKHFAYQTQDTRNQLTCKDCPAPASCRSLLLKTPAETVDLAVSREELEGLQDLLDQTILKMETRQFMLTALN